MQQFIFNDFNQQQLGMAVLNVQGGQCWYQIQIWAPHLLKEPRRKFYWVWLLTESGREIALEPLQTWGWGAALLTGKISIDEDLRIKELIISEEEKERKPRRPGRIVAGGVKVPAPPLWLPLPDPSANPRQIIGVIWDERGEVKYLAHGIWGHKDNPPAQKSGGLSPYRRFEAAAGVAGQEGWGYWLMYWNPKTNQIVYF